MDEDIPVFDKLPSDRPRLSALQKAFQDKYGKQPKFMARAPGRVNVIGEHIDYSGFGCLPAAIDRDVLVACSVQHGQGAESTVEISNTQSSQFPDQRFSYRAGKILLDKSQRTWADYVKCGMISVLENLPAASASKAIHLSLLVDGNVPPGGGLSSSAAMIVASALAAIEAYGTTSQTTKGQLAARSLESEQLAGVSTGGMDQCASILSKESALLNVEFVPKLACSSVAFPKTDPTLSYIICNTLITSEKQKTAKFNYNLRVVETRVAACLLAKHLGLQMKQHLPKLKDVLDAKFRSRADTVEEQILRLDSILADAEDCFGSFQNGHSWDQVLKELDGISQSDFQHKFHPAFDIEADKLKLYARTKHVFQEAQRVYRYRNLMEATEHDRDIPKKLGQLMNESHESCSTLYECSCPELEEVVQIARKVGSFGSRVTGAGWGGCTVHLCSSEDESKLMASLKDQYFGKRFPNLSSTELDEALFSTKPVLGACIYRS